MAEIRCRFIDLEPKQTGSCDNGLWKAFFINFCVAWTCKLLLWGSSVTRSYSNWAAAFAIIRNDWALKTLPFFKIHLVLMCVFLWWEHQNTYFKSETLLDARFVCRIRKHGNCEGWTWLIQSVVVCKLDHRYSAVAIFHHIQKYPASRRIRLGWYLCDASSIP